MAISIEDFCEDIIDKAQSGLRISNSELLSRSGITAQQLDLLKGGGVDEAALRSIAPHLDLDADSLVESAHKSWYPEPVVMEGLAQFNTPYPVPGYEEMTVNSYLVWDPASRAAIAFDTGADVSSMLASVKDNELDIQLILLTHTHGDHIADLDRLVKASGNAPVYVNRREPVPGAETIDEDWVSTVNVLKVRAYLTHGHSPGGTTFVVNGLEHPLAVVGDSLFANSMGGSPRTWQQALDNNRSKILILPDDTVVCAGHGPLTTVGEEKRHNPFFPELK